MITIGTPFSSVRCRSSPLAPPHLRSGSPTPLGPLAGREAQLPAGTTPDRRTVTDNLFINVRALVLLVCLTPAGAIGSSGTLMPIWVVDPTDPGPDQPYRGVSVFDEIFS